MSVPFYQSGAVAARSVAPESLKSAHTGLWYTRFYDAFNPQGWSVKDDGKRSWIDKTIRIGPSGNAEQLQHLVQRQHKLCKVLGGVCAQFETDGPFVTGMGLSHPVENGFTFHPTLGVPYLPASGIKGLLRGWVEGWMDDEKTNGVVQRWFGAAKDNDSKVEEGAGNLIFFDALPSQPVRLACDIMTPHMGQWYEKGGELEPGDYAAAAPADWHSPVPVPFLVVKSATKFQFMIAPRKVGDAALDAQAQADVVLAMQELKKALEWMGAGAKTATGYGRMIECKAADIKSGIEQWDKAQVKWNKGRATLDIIHTGGRKASQSGPDAKSKYDRLSENARKRLDKDNKPVFVNATVSCNGNMITLISIEEIGV